MPLTMIENALHVNNKMSKFVVERFQQLVIDPVEEVLLAGIAYKPGISDLRESPSIYVATELQSHGYKVLWSDIHVTIWEGFEKFDPITNSISGLIILQEINTEVLNFALRCGAVILDCTGRYDLPGVHQL
jgi:UDP-N-acetyl-D-mannosaminuronate dehydrogenase